MGRLSPKHNSRFSKQDETALLPLPSRFSILDSRALTLTPASRFLSAPFSLYRVVSEISYWLQVATRIIFFQSFSQTPSAPKSLCKSNCSSSNSNKFNPYKCGKYQQGRLPGLSLSLFCFVPMFPFNLPSPSSFLLIFGLLPLKPAPQLNLSRVPQPSSLLSVIAPTM